ncbi:MAG: hypothetical protein U0165_19905 [Polyangiaceae bacterium]
MKQKRDISLHLTLVDPDIDLCEAWRTHFVECQGVDIVHGRFEQLDEYDCLVSAANSFGLMDGGVDGAITTYFGDGLMDRVQARFWTSSWASNPWALVFLSKRSTQDIRTSRIRPRCGCP